VTYYLQISKIPFPIIMKSLMNVLKAGSTTGHQERKVTEDPVTEAGASSPKIGNIKIMYVCVYVCISIRYFA